MCASSRQASLDCAGLRCQLPQSSPRQRERTRGWCGTTALPLWQLLLLGCLRSWRALLRWQTWRRRATSSFCSAPATGSLSSISFDLVPPCRECFAGLASEFGTLSQHALRHLPRSTRGTCKCVRAVLISPIWMVLLYPFSKVWPMGLSWSSFLGSVGDGRNDPGERSRFAPVFERGRRVPRAGLGHSRSCER